VPACSALAWGAVMQLIASLINACTYILVIYILLPFTVTQESRMTKLMVMLEKKTLDGNTGGTGNDFLLTRSRDSIDPADLLKASVSTHSVLASLVDKQILMTYRKQDFILTNPERFDQDSNKSPAQSVSDMNMSGLKASTGLPLKMSNDSIMNSSLAFNKS
jgi:hypothetical protein